MNCYYCNCLLTDKYIYGDGTDHCSCNICNVEYFISKNYLHIKFNLEINEDFYALNIYPLENKMILTWARDLHDEIEFKFLFNDLTPQNVEAKIKFLLTYY